MSAVPDLDALLAHAGWLERLSQQLCRDEHRAADAVQETWHAALRSPPRDARNLRGFLATLLRNVLRLRARADAARARREGGLPGPDFVEAAADAAARAELDRFLTGQVLALPEPQRGLVLLHYYQGEPVAVVARRSGLSADAVRAHLRRARETLRARLRAHHGPARAGFALVLAAVRPALPLAITIMTTKILAAVAVGAVLAFLAWQYVWPAGPAAPAANGEPRPAVPIQAAPEQPVTPPSTGELSRTTVNPPEAERVLHCRLTGLHRDAPWTAAVHVDLEGRDAKEENLESVQHLHPDGEGAFAVALPAWTATCTLFRTSFRADDPLYLPLVERERAGSLAESRLGVAGVFELPVQVVSVLTGKVVDPQGAPVPGARLLALPWRDGQVPGSPRPQANTAADGSFFLQAPMAADLLVLAIPTCEASLSGKRMIGPHGAIPDNGILRHDLLAASARATTQFGVSQDLGILTLPGAVSILGVVREAGRPLSGVGVAWLDDVDLLCELDGLRIERMGDGRMFVQPGRDGPQRCVTDAEGRFSIPAAPGQRGACSLVQAGTRFAPRVECYVEPRAVSAPAQVDFDLAPAVVVQVRRGDAPVKATVWHEPWLEGLYLTDERGEVRFLRESATELTAKERLAQSLLPRRLKVRAPGEAEVVVEVPADCSPERPIVVQLGERPMRHVALEVEGDFRVRQVVGWLKPLDAKAGEIPFSRFRNDSEGPFQLEVPPGRYQLTLWPPQKAERRDTFLIPTQQDVEVGAGDTSWSVRMRHGGRIALEAFDANGVRVEGTVKLIATDGTETAPHLRSYEIQVDDADRYLGYVSGYLPREGGMATPNLLPGTWQVVVDLGAQRVHRRTVEVKACEVTEVKIRLP
jgi:RNA polymerase sigma factor (sigma-70 family)